MTEKDIYKQTLIKIKKRMEACCTNAKNTLREPQGERFAQDRLVEARKVALCTRLIGFKKASVLM
jgi:hypothetical protein